MKDIVIFGGARDYHVMDWYRTIRSLVGNRKIIMLTDLIGGENYKVIVKEDDKIEKILIIDKFLFKKQTKLGSIWRNLVKLYVSPIQVYYLKKIAKKNPNSVFHAQPMYYMFVCYLAGVDFIGTPQGSELLVRPEKSKIYKYFVIKVLKAAKYITVDSQSMKDTVFELSGKKAIVIQNGIDVKILISNNSKIKRDKISSIRGMTSLYRIEDILDARNYSNSNLPIEFIYPFEDKAYTQKVTKKFIKRDKDLGRLSKENMYNFLRRSYLVISIPRSDSSPRSVYEAIFSGACLAITYNKYIDVLPKCMKDRIYIVNLNNKNWFSEAVSFAKENIKTKYIPSKEAIDMFDQDKTMKRAIDILYK